MLLSPSHSAHSLAVPPNPPYTGALSPSILNSSKSPLPANSTSTATQVYPRKCSFNSGPLSGPRPPFLSRNPATPNVSGPPTTIPTLAMGSSLLARRKSNAGVNGIRPLISELALSDMPPTLSDTIHASVIGPSALASVLASPRSESGFTPGSLKGVLEKAFLGSTKNRRPTPYPEKRDPLDEEDKPEEEDNEEEEESREEESDLSDDPIIGVDDL